MYVKGEGAMNRRLLAVAASTAMVFALSAAPALAAHDHYIVTPNGQCHQVASGQTSISDATHGGFHRFHDNVHTGAAGGEGGNKILGHGHAAAEVYKSLDAPSICF